MSVQFGSSLSKDHLDASGDDPAQARAELEAIIDRLNNKLVNVTILTAADKTGNDSGIVSGTAGTNGNLVQWNADGDAVDGPDVLSAISPGSDTDVVSKAAVQGAGVAALVPLAQATANDDATVDFTSNIDSTYDTYIFHVEGVRPSSDDFAQLRTSADGGSTWDDGTNNYAYRTIVDTVESTGTSVLVPFTGSKRVDSTARNSFSGWVILHKPSDSSKRTIITWQFGYINENVNPSISVGSACRQLEGSTDGVRLFFSASNIAEGIFRMYGVKKS